MVPPYLCDTIIPYILCQVTTLFVTSTFFIDNKLGILSVFLVGTDKQKIKACGNAEAQTCLSLKLSAKIGGAVIKEFCLLTTGQDVFQIDEFTGQYIEILHLWQTLNLQKLIQFANQLHLEFLKLLFSAKIDVSLPNVKRIFSVCIAPFAVFLVEIAVGLAARGAVLKRHSATLANEFSRRAEKRVDGHVKQLGKELECIDIWYRFARFPYLKILVMYECLRLLA